ncbi:hypothetical protein C4K68_07090 [Pokkaliibacter plantistimulans]|uniref:Alpha/beta hydrolase n=1 Tax=Proteobacteria bacterium 228 TaxID=2083153 RepID=A0A2S5KT35_9PROT|nr:hypothetical protein [Pokkaliibacter plantistimulans]PPC78011.1 hypothetical protein C4K68_07090 [Pokkaliibacter plantistimulans]
MRELVILLPGIGRAAKYQQRDSFCDGLCMASEQVLLNRIDDPQLPQDLCRLSGQRDGQPLTLDVVEAYWNDMVPSLSQQPLSTRIQRGLSLFLYWGLSPVWQGWWQRKYLTLSILLSGLMLVFWYYSTLALFAQALVNSSDSSTALLGHWLDGILSTMGSWKLWALVTLLMGVLPVTSVVDAMDFSKRYTAEEAAGPDTPALRLQIIRRVREQIRSYLALADSVADSDGQLRPYQRITLVAHSFGTVIAIDVLADLPLSVSPGIRLFTLGSPLELLHKRVPWLLEEQSKCMQRNDLLQWLDITSPADWLATGADVDRLDDRRIEQLSIRASGTLTDRLAARIHSRYFDNQQVCQRLLAGQTAPASVPPAAEPRRVESSG